MYCADIDEERMDYFARILLNILCADFAVERVRTFQSRINARILINAIYQSVYHPHILLYSHTTHLTTAGHLHISSK